MVFMGAPSTRDADEGADEGDKAKRGGKEKRCTTTDKEACQRGQCGPSDEHEARHEGEASAISRSMKRGGCTALFEGLTTAQRRAIACWCVRI